jgi:hypothetical protein
MKKAYYTTTVTTIVVDTDTRMFRVMDYLRSLRDNQQNKTRLVLAHGNAPDTYGENKDYIPCGSIVEVDFVCDSGLYCIVDVDGKLRKCLIPLEHLHKLHYPTID